MPASLTSEESGRAPSSLSTNHPPSTSTAASSRATSPLPIPTDGKPKRRPSTKRTQTVGASSLSPPRAFSPPPRTGSRAGMSPPPLARSPSSRETALLTRVLAEEDRMIARLREQVSELATELRVRTEALESAYERVQSADKRTVETHQKYLAELNARQHAEAETRRAQEETRKTQVLLDVAEKELARSRKEIENLEAEKAEAESAAGRARAIARELKQTMRVNKARELGIAEGRGSVDALEERIHKEELAAAVKAAFDKGRAEGEASATMKALAAFDRLMESDELDGWDDKAKMNTRQEIVDSSRKSPKAKPTESEPSRAKSPAPLQRKWSLRRNQS